MLKAEGSTTMFGKFQVLMIGALFGLLTACTMPKEDAIVSAAVVAELAQSQDARPSDIDIEKVSFDNRQHARIMAVRRLPDGRILHTVPFICEAERTAERWNVKCAERQNP
jgi:hypothetical protein